MKTTQIILLISITSLLLLSVSCKKYLEIKPEADFLDETVYGNEVSIQNVVNGFYKSMASSSLYGGDMSMTTIDVLGQYYNTSSYGRNRNWQLYASYGYTDATTKNTFDAIWSSMYRLILEINVFIDRVQQISPSVLTADKKNIMLGEAYALRAFLHFDLLRLYGPIYVVNKDADAIPYSAVVSNQAGQIYAAKEIIVKVKEDINKSLSLLENDPVRKEGVVRVTGLDITADFYKLRNRRMNYFAAQALLARVLLYEGNKNEAGQLAIAVITDCSKYFQWSAASLSLPLASNPDRLFSSELLFGIENMNLYTVQQLNFASSVQNSDILVPTEKVLNATYPFANDYRFRSAWILDPTSNKTVKTFFKFNEVKNIASTIKYLQPLMRISELYYIATEGVEDKNQALNYLNEVRKNRGLDNLALTANLDTELMSEYRREFWGEGQLFFYYKRKNLVQIPNGNSVTSFVTMNADKYVVPLPDSEINNR